MSAPVRHAFAGSPLAALAREHGTPLFVYDAAEIARRIALLGRFDVIRYAQKANGNLALLALMRRAGVLVDAVSAGEIERALAAGFPTQGEPPPIAYTADLFDAPALELVVRHNLHVNAGSMGMIEQYAHSGPARRDLTLRINPGFGHGHSQKVNTGGPCSKHGIWHESLGDALALARRHGLSVHGLHVHIGSGVDFHHLGQVTGALEALALEAGSQIHTISAGGGLPIPYRAGEPELDTEQFYAPWDEARQRLARAFRHPVRLEVEPGRYLVASAGILLARVCATKRQGTTDYALLDAGFNDLVRPAMYGAHHDISLVVPPGTAPRAPRAVVVGGPLCESGDIFTQGPGGEVHPRQMPELFAGDLVAIEVAGAYAASMGSNYNTRPLAAEVLVEGGVPRLVRRRQTSADLLALERP